MRGAVVRTPFIYQSRLRRSLDPTLGGVLALISRLRSRAHKVLTGSWRRARSIDRDRWWLVVFAFIMLAFLVVLFFQPSAVGRGGR
jgi:drug/metabolite transporter (DMT)-like permease